MAAFATTVTALALALAVHGAASADISPVASIPQAMVGTIQGNLAIGSQRLFVMQGLQEFTKKIVPYICKGKPALVAHTPNLGPNGACFAGTEWPTLESNLSCTCLTYLNETEWTFKVKNTESFVEKKLPLEQSTESVLEVDSCIFFGVAPAVKTLNLIGVGPKQVPIQLMKTPIQGPNADVVALIISPIEATISTVYVENIDFNTKIVDTFVPTILKNLTMKNCNISSFSTAIVNRSDALAVLDLSNNALDDSLGDMVSNSLTSLNLSSNKLTKLPSLRFRQLSSLSLTNNPISSRTVDPTVFALMKAQLKTFDIDPIQNCSEGELQTIMSGQVCVYQVATQAPLTAAPAPANNGVTTYLIIGLIVGCVIIAVLVFILVKKNSCRSDEAHDFTKEPLDGYFDNTLSYDDTHPTISASLLNDPIVITNRIPYNEIRVANCISKGGFGLVYSGVYNRRRVAIKKIRPDRAGDIKMIEAFLREICLMATLHHPHIVEFVGVSWDSLRNLSAVTEFMERGDLREVLHGCKLRNTPLTWDNHKTRIALHIAEGMTYLHSLSPKVIHRDLKSKNVLLNSEMDAKLSDFGISRERNIEETHMTAGIGTSFWIAPEVLLGKDYDEHADIFSFGVVLSEIDTDDYPYWNASNPNVGNKAQENMILQMVASGAMRPSFSDSCPKAVLELADLCLQVDPANRPTAAEVAYKLQQIVQFMNVPSRGGGSLV